MKTIGVMILSETLIHILASTLQTIIRMVGEHEVLMALVVLGAERMNIDILSDSYDKKGLHARCIILDISDGNLVFSK